jgi:integrase
MSSMYRRGNVLWLAFKDERGIRVCKPSGYRVGDETAARELLAELDRKAAEAAPAPAAIAVGAVSREVRDDKAVMPAASQAVGLKPEGPTVREYGERWLGTRTEVATARDEQGRLRNHVFPHLGDMRMREVRPRHIRDLILELRRSNVRLRGTAQGVGTELMAPRTIRHVYSLLGRMFSTAVIDEVIDTSPVIVAKGVLPKNVDKDPAWRATALYEREELVRLISDPRIRPERRVLTAIEGLGGTRHGEAAGLRWSNYFADAKPLGKLVIARSYDKNGTKTESTRLVPVHPVLAQLLRWWCEGGWAVAYGRAPMPADLIVPRPRDEDDLGRAVSVIRSDSLWLADEALRMLHRDLDMLGMRRRRGHDLRRTFITLAQEDGAQRDILRVITHAPDAADVMSLYTSYPWPRLCAEVAKLKIELPADGDLPSRVRVQDNDSTSPVRARDDNSTRRVCVQDHGSSRGRVENDDSTCRGCAQDHDSTSRGRVRNDDSTSRGRVEDDDLACRVCIQREDSTNRGRVENDDSASRGHVQGDECAADDGLPVPVLLADPGGSPGGAPRATEPGSLPPTVAGGRAAGDRSHVRAAEPVASDAAGPVLTLLASRVRPTEPGGSLALATAEACGARRSFGEVGARAVALCSATGSATCSAENPVISSRWPGLNRRPTVYETVALPLSYSGVVRRNWYPRPSMGASGGAAEDSEVRRVHEPAASQPDRLGWLAQTEGLIGWLRADSWRGRRVCTAGRVGSAGSVSWDGRPVRLVSMYVFGSDYRYCSRGSGVRRLTGRLGDRSEAEQMWLTKATASYSGGDTRPSSGTRR